MPKPSKIKFIPATISRSIRLIRRQKPGNFSNSNSHPKISEMILNIILYSFTVFIWGSTWFAITLQLNHVNPILSVAYRFFLSSMILYIFFVVNKKNLSLEKEKYALLLIQGITLYSGSYYLIYLASKYVNSGLIAVLFSSVLIFNILNLRLFYRIPPQKKSILGGFAGVLGIMLVFYPEISFANMDNLFVGFILSVGASLGCPKTQF